MRMIEANLPVYTAIEILIYFVPGFFIIDKDSSTGEYVFLYCCLYQ